jgi:ankyrin repeat protein
MKIRSFLSRVFHSQISRFGIVMLIALAYSIPAFCGEIHDAARKGNIKKVKALLKKNPDLVSSKDNEGWTPLYWAVHKKDVVELLLANKAEVNIKDKNAALTHAQDKS